MAYDIKPVGALLDSQDTRYCPADGWVPDERVHLEETPNVRVQDCV